MKTKAPSTGFQCDENCIVDIHEMFSLLIGKDLASRQAFRNDVLKRAAQIRLRHRKEHLSSDRNSNIIRFPIGYSCSA